MLFFVLKRSLICCFCRHRRRSGGSCFHPPRESYWKETPSDAVEVDVDVDVEVRGVAERRESQTDFRGANVGPRRFRRKKSFLPFPGEGSAPSVRFGFGRNRFFLFSTLGFSLRCRLGSGSLGEIRSTVFGPGRKRKRKEEEEEEEDIDRQRELGNTNRNRRQKFFY